MASSLINNDPNAVINDALFMTAAQWVESGHGVAIAFVMETWGSSPRPAGSIMVIRNDMAIAGSVSGGCVEAAVIDAGLQAMQSGSGKRLDFGVADAAAWEVGLSCGGNIAVLVCPITIDQRSGLPFDMLANMATALGQRQIVRLCLDATTGAVVPGNNAIATNLDAVTNCFTLVQHPPRRLIIIGGVHITQFLAPMAQQTGYDVVVIDPRSVFASPERLPGVRIINGWPDEVMVGMHIDDKTAIVTLTHDPKIDDSALHVALGHDSFYVSCLGSRKTHSARCDRLAASGFDEVTTARIHGPAGLDIGARTPAEIAVSILAEMIAVERKSTKEVS